VGHNASIMLVGDNKEIDELVLFGIRRLVFTVIRVLKRYETRRCSFSILQKKSNIDMEQTYFVRQIKNKF
jgi:hypothetical protein